MPQELKIKVFIKIWVEFSEIEGLFDYWDHPLSYSSHLGVAHLNYTSRDNKLVPKKLKFKVSAKNWQWRRQYQYFKVVDNKHKYDYNTTNYMFYNWYFCWNLVVHNDDDEYLLLEKPMMKMIKIIISVHVLLTIFLAPPLAGLYICNSSSLTPFLPDFHRYLLWLSLSLSH